MLLLLLLSLELHISPNPIEGRMGDKIPLSVIIVNEEGEPTIGVIEFEIVPHDLGRIENNTLIPNKNGRGVLKCEATMDGEKITGYAYIHITEEKKARIVPTSVTIEIGEEIQFKILEGNLIKWKVIPEEIGGIRDGLFKAKKTGRGRIVAILENGNILSAFVRVKGKIGQLEIFPRFKRVKIGEKIQFSIKEKGNVIWEVEPEDIGNIDENGLFSAKSPGRGIVIVKIKEGSTELIGRAILVVSGKIRARIIPEKISLRPGESARFQIKFDPDITNREIPVKWKVIPKECGIIRKDGTFLAGKFPLIGRVVAIIPERFGGGFASSRISIIPRRSMELTILPRFKELEVNEEFTFRTLQNISVNWKVTPKNLGTITQDGKFTPTRSGSGVIVAEPKDYINMRPARALVIVGNNPVVNIYLPGEIFERFSVPIRIITNLKDYRVFWHVIPEHAGYVSGKGVFNANPLLEGKSSEDVTTYAILHKNREILGWGKFRIKIVKIGSQTKN